MKALIIIGKVLACLAGALFFPYLFILLLLWSPIAWILGLIFPGKNFYPINKAWSLANSWVESKLGIDLNTIVLLFFAFLTFGAVVGWIVGLFSCRE